MKFLIVVFFILLLPVQGAALTPSEVLVVANRFVPGSVDLARYYMEKRGIPEDNLLKITTSEKEKISRKYYDKEIAAPVRKAVLNNPRIRCLVTISGVPLKVSAPELSREEKAQLKALQQDKKRVDGERKELSKNKPADAERSKALKAQAEQLAKQIKALKKGDYAAAVDSELSLILAGSYDLKFWQPNPYFVGNRKRSMPFLRDQVLFVSRLDGPSEAIVKRIIDQSIAAEKEGLHGKAYFDARYPRPEKSKLTGSAFYDQSIHLAAERVRLRKTLPVVVNDQDALFQPGEAPDAALYCGWYKLSNYVDAFDWVPGAVGYHIASQECQTLKAGSGNYWCKRMLEDGAAAVIGPVAEPYLQAFPVPEAFFSFLTDGYYSLVEAYYLSLPYLSWQMVLVGDPLYLPFANHK